MFDLDVAQVLKLLFDMLSLFIDIVFCISATVISANHSGSERSQDTLSTLCNNSFISPPRAPITPGTIVILYPGHLPP